MTHPTPAARERILEATLAIIAEGGVDAVRYREVAARAQVPLGGVSYHFASREELVRAAFSAFLVENSDAIARVRARLPGRPKRVADVATFLAAIAEADLDDPRRRFVAEYELIAYAARDPEIAARLATWEAGVIAELADVLGDLGVPRPAAAARTLTELLRGFQLVHLGRDRASVDLTDFRTRVQGVLEGLVRIPSKTNKKGMNDAKRRTAR